MVESGRRAVIAFRLFSALVIGGQAALCVTVLACAVMLTQSARMARNVQVGYDPERVLTASLGGAVRTSTIAREDARRVLAALQSLPEVADAAVARGSLVGGSAATLGVSTPVGVYRVYQQQTSEQYLRVLGADRSDVLPGMRAKSCPTTAAAFVRQKRRELAIRAALGASSAQIRWLVAAQVGRPVGFGLAVGAGLATLAGTGLSGVLVDVSPFNPTWVAMGSAILIIIAGVAVAGSLRAATRIPPATALKAE